MKYLKIYSLLLNAILLSPFLLAINTLAQSLEMAAGAGNPTGNGPTIANQVITFQENTNDPTGNTFAAFTPTVTATFEFQNQAYTLPTTQMSTGTGMAFGAGQNTSGNLAASNPIFNLINVLSSPANNNFTSRNSVTSGTGIDVATNRGIWIANSMRPLYNSNSPINGRYYYGDLKITFSRPVNNPIIHIIGLGGTSGGNSLGTTVELELTTTSAAQMTLSELSGSTELNVTASKILNNATTLGATTGSGAATGSVRATGTNITSITFQVFVRSDNRSGGLWGGNNIHNADSWLISVSAEKPQSISGNVFNDPNAGNVNNSSGSANSVPSGMFANLVDSNNKVVASTSVATDGTYSFTGIFPETYTMVLSTTAGTQGATAPSASLPSGWANTGEFNGTPDTGTDSTVNGISAAFTVSTANVTNINFGIRQPVSDLTIAKSHSGSFTIGSTGTYVFTVTNIGAASSSGTITVTDTLPVGLTVNAGAVGAITEGGTNAANWTCNSAALTGSPARQTITCTSSNAIAASGLSVFNFPVNVGTSTAVGTNSITNTATVSGGGEINTSNNSSNDPTTVLAPDLTISKTDSGSSFTIGSLGNYAFTVSNGGTASSSGTITVSDTLPTGLIVNGGTAGVVTLYGTNAANWACSSTASTPQTVTCTSSTVISASSSSTFNFDVYVGSSTPSSITNTTTVSGGGEVNTTNNSGSDSTTVLAETIAPAPGTVCSAGTAVNLLSTVPFSAFQDANVTSGISSTIPLIANASNYRLGTGASNRIIVDLSWGWNNGEPSINSTQSTYTLTINGTDYARITTERNPIGMIATVVGLNGASVSDSTIAVGSYPPTNYQQSYVTLPASVTQITSGSVVFASPGAAPGDDIGFRISTIYACSPAVSVNKSSNGPWAIGQTGAQYSLDVTNAGAATTFGTTTVRDALPTGITPNWTGTRNVTSNGLTWACTFSGQNVSCTTSNALSNASGSNTSQITLPVNVTTATAVGTNSITNYASIGGGGDPSNSGNAPTPGASCSPSGLCTSHQTTVNSPDLTISKSHSGDFTRGSTGVYTITAGNSGTVATSGTITVADTLPTGLNIADGAITLGGANSANWTCNAVSNVITCNSSTVIAINGSSVFTFTVNVASNAAATVNNTATVSGGNEATANNGNNSSIDPTNTTSSPPNVVLNKSCPSPANCTTAPQLPGTDVTYRIEFTNSGGQGASNMMIMDGVPTNTDFKVGSATTSLGTTGLTIVIEYSSDFNPSSPGLATWTYTPVSGGGSASAGYDRNVKAVRWRVTSGTLSNTSPNNNGYVEFLVKIR